MNPSPELPNTPDAPNLALLLDRAKVTGDYSHVFTARPELAYDLIQCHHANRVIIGRLILENDELRRMCALWEKKFKECELKMEALFEAAQEMLGNVLPKLQKEKKDMQTQVEIFDRELGFSMISSVSIPPFQSLENKSQENTSCYSKYYTPIQLFENSSRDAPFTGVGQGNLLSLSSHCQGHNHNANCGSTTNNKTRWSLGCQTGVSSIQVTPRSIGSSPLEPSNMRDTFGSSTDIFSHKNGHRTVKNLKLAKPSFDGFWNGISRIKQVTSVPTLPSPLTDFVGRHSNVQIINTSVQRSPKDSYHPAFYKYGSYEVTVIPAKPFQGFPSFMLEEKDPSPSNAPIFAQTVVRWKQRQSVLAKTGTRSHSYLPMTDALQNVLNDIENSTIYSDALYVPIGHLFDPNIHVIPQFVVPLTSVQAFFNSYASLLAVEELQKWQDLSKVDQDLFRVFFEQCKKEQESQLVCGWVRIKKLEPVFPVQHALEETTGTSYRIAVESIQRRKRAVPTFSACSQLDDMLVERLEKRRRMT